MEQPLYHVMLEGRAVGPYDRRTIIGMRIKKALTSEHVLIRGDGGQFTVGDLIGSPRAEDRFNPNRSGSFSVVQATYTGALIQVEGRGLDIPAFKGEIEARVQSGVLRLAGRFRRGLGWKEDRAKIPLNDVAHARIKGSIVELWLRSEQRAKLQRIVLELFSPEAAGELVDWLPNATSYPEPAGPAGGKSVEARRAPVNGLMVAVVGVVLTVGIVLMAFVFRRMY